jgi:hypothetical protein
MFSPTIAGPIALPEVQLDGAPVSVQGWADGSISTAYTVEPGADGMYRALLLLPGTTTEVDRAWTCDTLDEAKALARLLFDDAGGVSE